MATLFSFCFIVEWFYTNICFVNYYFKYKYNSNYTPSILRVVLFILFPLFVGVFLKFTLCIILSLVWHIFPYITSEKSSFFPSPRYSWIAFLVARSARSWARCLFGVTVIPVSCMIECWFQENSVSQSTHWTISQKSHEHAIVIMEAFPVNIHCLIIISSISRYTVISSPHTAFFSVYTTLGCSIFPLCWGFVA